MLATAPLGGILFGAAIVVAAGFFELFNDRPPDRNFEYGRMPLEFSCSISRHLLIAVFPDQRVRIRLDQMSWRIAASERV